MMRPDKTNTGVVITDPQNDFLSPNGRGYHLTKGIIEQNNTVVNLERLMKTTLDKGYKLFISPHYLYPTDKFWKYKGTEQNLLLDNEVYEKKDGNTPPEEVSDYVPSLKPYIEDNRTIIATPHKVASPQTNDLIYQLRQNGIDKVVLAGVLSNVCVESHMRDLIENGFLTAVVYDATAATSELDFQAAQINFMAFSSAVWTTDQVLEHLV